METPSPMRVLPPWCLLAGPGVRFELKLPPVKVELSPAAVQALIEAVVREAEATNPELEKR